MGCNGPEKKCHGAANAAGVPQVDAAWSAARRDGKQCEKCGGFMTTEGQCNRCGGNGINGFRDAYTAINRGHTFTDPKILKMANEDGTTVAHWQATMAFSKFEDPEILRLADNSGNRVAHDMVRWGKHRIEDPEILALADSDGNTVAHTMLVHHKDYVPTDPAILGLRNNGGQTVGDWMAQRDDYSQRIMGMRDRNRAPITPEPEKSPEEVAALEARKQRQARKQRRQYFDTEVNKVEPAWLNGFKESDGFTRRDGETILESIRDGAIDKLSRRSFPDNEARTRAVAAINANTLKHTAQVMVMATKISAVAGADPQTAKVAGFAAGYHDSGKDDTNFVYHHVAGAEFADKSLRLNYASMTEKEIAGVKQAVMEHMAFGDGSNPGNFMNAALANEAAAIVKTAGGDWGRQRVSNEIAMRLFDDDVEKHFAAGSNLGTADIDGTPVTFMRDEKYQIRKESVMHDSESRRKLRYLMQTALQKDDAALERVEGWLEGNAGRYRTQGELGAALQSEFGGRELSYPTPSSEASRILGNAVAATGEHLGEVRRGSNGRSLLETSYSSGEITRMADGLMLSSAESLGKIVDIHQKQWGRAGTEPIVVSMASLCGGAYGQKGTAVDAAGAMTMPLVQQTAHQEIGLMREYMGHWQDRTFDNWAKGRPAPEAETRLQRVKSDPFTAFSPEEMLQYQPPIQSFHDEYQGFLKENEFKRGVIHRMS